MPKREPDPASCDRHSRAECYECLRAHHLDETTFLLKLLLELACECADGRPCELHARHGYLFGEIR